MRHIQNDDRLGEKTAMEDQITTMVDEETPEQSVSQPPTKPALTITVQSWATPVVGLLMLALGLLAGYYGRPLVDSPGTPSPPFAATSPATADPTSISSSDLEARQRALMEALIPQTVHFKGNPDAPVTLIEFSDFQ